MAQKPLFFDTTAKRSIARDMTATDIISGGSDVETRLDALDVATTAAAAAAAAAAAVAATANTTGANAIPTAEKGVASGVATLDGAGKVPLSQLPNLVSSKTSIVASQAAMLALPVHTDVQFAIRTDSIPAQIFVLGASADPTVLGNWTLTGTTAVASVASFAGRTGAVAPTSGDYNSTLVLNASNVTGATVTAALNNLSATTTTLAGNISTLTNTVVNLANGTGLTVSSDNVTNDSNVSGLTVSAALNTLLTDKFDAADLGVANGAADLAADGILSVNKHRGQIIWPAADQTAMLALSSARVNDLASRADQAKLYRLTALPASVFGNWAPYEGAAVQTVFGRTGPNITQAAGDYTASLVDNDSGVAGATVAAALDALDAGITVKLGNISEDTDPALGGNLSGGAFTVSNLTLGTGIREATVDLGNVTGNVSVNVSNGSHFYGNLTGNANITLSGFVAGSRQAATIRVFNPSTHTLTISGGTNRHWPGGAAPVQSTGNKTDVYLAFSDNNGSDIFLTRTHANMAAV